MRTPQTSNGVEIDVERTNQHCPIDEAHLTEGPVCARTKAHDGVLGIAHRRPERLSERNRGVARKRAARSVGKESERTPLEPSDPHAIDDDEDEFVTTIAVEVDERKGRHTTERRGDGARTR
jgi:hypothetical protein